MATTFHCRIERSDSALLTITSRGAPFGFRLTRAEVLALRDACDDALAAFAAVDAQLGILSRIERVRMSAVDRADFEARR